MRQARPAGVMPAVQQSLGCLLNKKASGLVKWQMPLVLLIPTGWLAADSACAHCFLLAPCFDDANAVQIGLVFIFLADCASVHVPELDG